MFESTQAEITATLGSGSKVQPAGAGILGTYKGGFVNTVFFQNMAQALIIIVIQMASDQALN